MTELPGDQNLISLAFPIYISTYRIFVRFKVIKIFIIWNFTHFVTEEVLLPKLCF